MRRGRALALLLGITGAVLAMGTGTAAADVTQPTHTILSMQLNGVVDPFMASYVRRGVATAADRGDVAVLITIDTPGGLDSSMREIISAILARRGPVISLTPP